MTERHVFWVFIEILLIVFIFTFCRSSSKSTPHQQQKQNIVTDRRKSEPLISRTPDTSKSLVIHRVKSW